MIIFLPSKSKLLHAKNSLTISNEALNSLIHNHFRTAFKPVIASSNLFVDFGLRTNQSWLETNWRGPMSFYTIWNLIIINVKNATNVGKFKADI